MQVSSEKSRKRLAVCSMGMWKLRRDLGQLYPDFKLVHPSIAGCMSVDGYLGWGNRPSGQRAQRLAKSAGLKPTLLEGGFLHGFFAGRSEPQASYIIDETGVHYDSTRPSDLETLISTGIADRQLLERARRAIDNLAQRQLSKYNSSPDLTLSEMGIIDKQPFVLLVDQVPHDASIAGAQADANTFAKMLEEAIRAWPDHQIVVRPHLASKVIGHLQEAATLHPDVLILKRSGNIWPLLKQADHVYTVSSHAGFEALFCGTPVTCFGYPFYAGWGLTTDALPAALVPNRGKQRSLEEVFAAAYIECSRYLDLHDRLPIPLEQAIEDLDLLVESRRRNGRQVATIGMSWWKRRAVEPFLVGGGGKPVHCKTVSEACKAAGDDGVVAVWGESFNPDISQIGSKVFRLEDGFLRSAGLGAALRFPLSLVRDSAKHLYYDARGRGTLEDLLSNRPFTPALIARADALIDLIVSQRLTKYQLDNDDQKVFSSSSHQKRLKILVTGQVEDDASIRFSAMGINTNTQLLQATRDLYPDALIAYREHPDVASNLRPGRADRSLADLDGDEASLPDLLDWCDRLETLTSLTGFEALLRGKSVGVHGWPFYAGWGLTEDRLERPARGKATLAELAVATFLLYPDYIHPSSRLPCSAERVVEVLTNPPIVPFHYRWIIHPAGQFIGGIKHRLKGRRLG